mmetsp:Transcript_2331/g.9863  ORF Transcript_2331/g.9863 Transcript_2331/m.9863 type:complete len:215 (+) Transcript_2331:1000-1644(+)
MCTTGTTLTGLNLCGRMCCGTPSGRGLQPLPTGRARAVDWTRDFNTGFPNVNGYDAILVAIDGLTKFAMFIPTTKTVTTAGVVALVVKHLVAFFGLPRRVVTGVTSSDGFTWNPRPFGGRLSDANRPLKPQHERYGRPGLQQSPWNTRATQLRESAKTPKSEFHRKGGTGARYQGSLATTWSPRPWVELRVLTPEIRISWDKQPARAFGNISAS